MSKSVDLNPYLETIESIVPMEFRGRVTELVGLVIKASVPEAKIGEVCLIRSPDREEELRAEVVGFRNNEALLLPLGEVLDISMGAEVVPTGSTLAVPVGNSLLGRVIDGLGRPIDGKGAITEDLSNPVAAKPPNALLRARVDEVLETGVRAIDGLLSVGLGQRVGIFSGAGVGKSTLLGMIARGAESDVNVIALIGERGREVREFLENDLGEEGLKKSIVVVATSNEPPLLRMKAAYAATAIAEHFREKGMRVVFMMDSVTRFARALREVGLAAGEPPARAGFPPSVFSELPRLLERTGNSENGSITAFYNVLVEGDDHNEPVADEVKSILDGHIVLSSELAAGAHYPAIDVGSSVSRVMNNVVEKDHLEFAQRLRDVIASYERQRDLISVGAYREGSDSRTDFAISKIGIINSFLRQDVSEHSALEVTVDAMQEIFE